MGAIDDSIERDIMATMLENQQNWLDDNAWNPPAGTNRGSIGSILMPRIRQMPEINFRNIVGVQPMTAPTGYPYTWTVTYNTAAFEDFAHFKETCNHVTEFDGHMIRCGKYENTMMCCEENCVTWQNMENDNE